MLLAVRTEKNSSRFFRSLAVIGWAAIFSTIWSSAFVAGKIGLDYTDPYTLLAARFFLAAIILFFLCLPTMKWHLLNDRTLLLDALILGALNNVLYLGLTFTSLRYISPELVVVVISCAPFFTSIISGLLGVERIRLFATMGIGIGFFGVLVITLARPIGTLHPTGLALALLGTLSFSAATVFYRNRAALHSPQQVNLWQSVIATLLIIPIVLFQTSQGTKTPPSLPLAAVVGYLAIVVTIGGMWMWLYLIRKSGATAASTYHLANPFCGLLLSHLILGNELKLTDFVGITIIVFGLFIVTRSTSGDTSEK